MKRRLLNLLTTLSLLLCAGAVAVWTRSYRGSDLVAHLAVASDSTRTRMSHRGLATLFGGRVAWSVAYDFPDGPPSRLLEVVGPPGWRVAGAGSPLEPPDRPSRLWPLWNSHTQDPKSLSEWDGYGFGWYAASIDPLTRQDRQMRMARIPLWLPPAAFAAPPALLLGVRVVHLLRRPRKGCCRSCGYDLTGNLSGVCPECGVAVGGPWRT